MKKLMRSQETPVASLSLALSMCSALLLGGCVAGPDFRAPDPPAVTAYTAAPVAARASVAPDGTATPLPAEWWTLLGSPKLNSLIAESVQGNRELAAAQATLVQSEELSYAASGARYPQIAFDASAGRDKYGAAFLGPEKLPPFNFFSLGPTLSFVLDTSGAVHRTIEQQQALTEVQQDQVDQTYLTLTGNVALQALAIAATHAQIVTVNVLISDDQEDLRLVVTAQQAGSATEVDRLNAASQLANDQTLLPPLERQLHVAQHALSVLMGRYPANWTPPDFELEDFVLPESVPLALPAELVHRRPDIRAAEAQLHAATAAVGVASANLYPQITLSASASLESTTLGTLFNASSTAGSLAASLAAPLYDHGTLRARRRAAAAAARAALDIYEQAVLRSFAQVADQLEALDQDAALIRAQQQAVEVSGKNLALTRESYADGYTGILQVLEAERFNQRAQLGLVQARVGRYEDTMQLLLALGGQAPPTVRTANTP
jgi:NodT family efflux transporter outer membrane factor (OMF) lipoprotein